MHHTVARGAGVLAVLTGASALTIDTLSWSGVGPGVRLDQHAVLMTCSIILTLVWAVDAVVRSEQRPLVREVARQRGAARDTAEELAQLRGLLVTRLAVTTEASGLDPEMIDAARRIARRLLEQE